MIQNIREIRNGFGLHKVPCRQNPPERSGVLNRNDQAPIDDGRKSSKPGKPRKRAPRLELQVPEHIMREIEDLAREKEITPNQLALHAVLNRVLFDRLKEQNEKLIRQNGHLTTVIEIIMEQLESVGGSIKRLGDRLGTSAESIQAGTRSIEGLERSLKAQAQRLVHFENVLEQFGERISALNIRMDEASRERKGLREMQTEIFNDLTRKIDKKTQEVTEILETAVLPTTSGR